ncbi:MAG: 4Fe-4S binding protein [Thermoplasmata archaeon]|nr:4Fe-4S binding protein [Thermoplasmata archaeon]
MLGKEIVIDKEKCDGCGLCVTACHEGALALVDGKAELVRRDFCDGLGDCLPACPQGAITFKEPEPRTAMGPATISLECNASLSSGYQWPIQLALVPPKSDYFRGTLVIAADCTAFTLDDFKRKILDGRPVVIGCPKLDERSRFDKVLAILSQNPIDQVIVVRMEVPCCRALTNIVTAAASQCGRKVKVTETVVSRGGAIVLPDAPSPPSGMIRLR